LWTGRERGKAIGVLVVNVGMRHTLMHFALCRSLLGAAQALEGQGLPVPAAELRAQGVDLAARWEERREILGEGPPA
jgi:hypothetical protein